MMVSVAVVALLGAYVAIGYVYWTLRPVRSVLELDTDFGVPVYLRLRGGRDTEWISVSRNSDPCRATNPSDDIAFRSRQARPGIVYSQSGNRLMFHVGEGELLSSGEQRSWPFDVVTAERIDPTSVASSSEFKIANLSLIDECAPSFWPYLLRLPSDIIGDARSVDRGDR